MTSLIQRFIPMHRLVLVDPNHKVETHALNHELDELIQ